MLNAFALVETCISYAASMDLGCLQLQFGSLFVNLVFGSEHLRPYAYPRIMAMQCVGIETWRMTL